MQGVAHDANAPSRHVLAPLVGTLDARAAKAWQRLRGGVLKHRVLALPRDFSH